MPETRKPIPAFPLREQVRCPHCWHVFAPEETLWVSAHPDLRGDPCLTGEHHQRRFLPTRFDAEGRAIDVKGLVCRQLACPHCHLTVPRATLEMDSSFLSILGAPGSGKSYLLAAMTWALQRTLLQDFGLDFVDVDPDANAILSGYHATLFANPQEDQLVSLPKTDIAGDLYEEVLVGERVLKCAKPFIFAIQPNAAHPHAGRSKLSQTLCLYDNAGEHFLPGNESASSPVTQHLSLARALLFLFDPTQHPEFRKACREKSTDPQMREKIWAHQQHLVLQEAAKRIRETTGMPQSQKHRRPLIVVITKYDAWSGLAKGARLESEWAIKKRDGRVAELDVNRLREISASIRKLLEKYARELVSAAEAFSSDVIYVPVSALGRGPEIDPVSKVLGIRPRDVAPMWAEVPMLYALHRSVPGLILSADRSSNAARAARLRMADSASSTTARDPSTELHVAPETTGYGDGDLRETGT
jgi:hypothetical protein